MGLTALAVAVAVAVVAPLGHLVLRATERGWDTVEAIVWRPRTLQLIGRSVGLAATVTVVCVVVGIGAAWLVARSDLPGRRVWRVLFGLPLALPSYVAAWAWMGWRPDLAGFRGAVLVLSSISYPYVYLPVLAALQRADPALEEVARSLGRSPLRVFLSVTLRQVRVAATGGALLAGLYALSDFGAVSIVRHETLTHTIYRSYRASFDRTPAAILGCVLVLIALVVVAGEARWRRSERQDRVGGGADRPARPVALGWARIPALVASTTVVGLALGVPAGNLLRWLRRGTSQTDYGELMSATGTTLLVALVAALVTVMAAVPIGVLSARYPGRLPRLVTSAAYAGHALPGITVSLALVFFSVRVVPGLYQRMPVLVFAYVVLFLSLAVGSVQAAVASVPPALEEVARTLGRSRWGAWRAVTIRLASPGIGAGAALVCLSVMKELPATLLLRPTGMDTLATELWGLTDVFSYAAAAPYAAAIVVLAAVPTALLTLPGRIR